MIKQKDKLFTFVISVNIEVYIAINEMIIQIENKRYNGDMW